MKVISKNGVKRRRKGVIKNCLPFTLRNWLLTIPVLKLFPVVLLFLYAYVPVANVLSYVIVDLSLRGLVVSVLRFFHLLKSAGHIASGMLVCYTLMWSDRFEVKRFIF